MTTSDRTTDKSAAAAALNARIAALLEPALAEAHFELVDVTLSGGTLQVLVELAEDHPVGGRIDLDGVSAATRIVDEVLEANDPIPSAYTLEVSSPGLERPLRTPAHFVRFVGSTVNVKTVPGTDGERRVEGRLERADSDTTGGIVVGGRTISYASIERARTVFVWGGQPKGAKPPKPGAKVKPGAGAPRKPHPKTLEAEAAAAAAAALESVAALQADDFEDDEFEDDEFDEDFDDLEDDLDESFDDDLDDEDLDESGPESTTT